MNNPANNGGPAFPRPAVNDKMGWLGAQQGMSLRDYFVAAALPAIDSLRQELFLAHSAAGIAAAAYALADAMLAEREKP